MIKGTIVMKTYGLGSVGAIAGLLLSGCASKAPALVADSLYYGGPIVTMNDAHAGAEALAVKDGRILAVGARADVERNQKGASTRVVDLGGKSLMPGFIDAHSHYINTLSVASQVKLYAPPAGPGRDVESIIAELKKFAAEHRIPKGEMIMAYGYDDTVMPDDRRLNRDDLDAAFPDNPVRVDHGSMHGAVMNSIALNQFGFDANTKTPPGGIIVRKPGTTDPWGLIMETAFLPVFEKTPPLAPEQEIAGTKAAHLMYAEAGITTAQEGATHVAQLRTIKRAAEAGANLIDVVAYPFISDLDKILNSVDRALPVMLRFERLRTNATEMTMTVLVDVLLDSLFVEATALSQPLPSRLMVGEDRAARRCTCSSIPVFP